jgi:hypothetical protein
MHRSSTSMLSGLLIQGLGYEIGGPELPIAQDNPKGFFERTDVVDMNNAFLNSQNMTWDNHDKILEYNTSLTEEHLLLGIVSNATFGDTLQFYNGRHSVPYVFKDPRCCLTVPVWMKHLNPSPAILFSYRHPLDVAASLQRRDNFPLIKGLKLWIIYNVLAVRYSNGYCRVVTSSHAVVFDTLNEMTRISRELTNRCRVIPSPNATMPASVVDGFVDHSLQHNTNGAGVQYLNGTIHDFGDGCVARPLSSGSNVGGSEEEMKVTQTYLIAMQLFCDFRSGRAFSKDYEMPDLTKIYDVPPPTFQ